MKEIIKRKKTDLFSYLVGTFLFKNRVFLFILRLTISFLFAYAIVLGFIYPTKEDNLFTTALFWGLFWSFFMVFSLSTLGRVFCGICPHGFIGKYVTQLGLNKEIPKWLKNPFIGLTLLLLGYWLLVFMFPRIYTIPLNTAIFFFILTLISIVFYFLYKDMAYCKYICPLGTVTRVFSKNSFTKLETYNEGCLTCKTFECAKVCSYNLKPFTFEKKNSMEDCTLCMDCAIACENVAFNLKKPASDLFKRFKVQKFEVWTVLILTAILSFAMTFKHGLNRTTISNEFIWNKLSVFIQSFIQSSFISINDLSVLAFSIVFVVGLNILGMYIASKIMKLSYDKVFYTLSYSLVPLFIVGGLSHILEYFFLHYASNIINGFNHAFGLGMNTMQPLAKRGEPWLLIFIAFTHLAYIFAFIIMIYRLKLLDCKKYLKILAYPFASFVIIAYMSLNFYVGYVFQTYGVKQNHHSMHLKGKEK